MKILVINGANINMLGIREPEIYGSQNYEYLVKIINDYAKKKNIDIEIFQSNHEGDIVDKIQKAYFDKVDGIVINPGGYTHTSVVILDALKAVNIKTVEVHISDIYTRDEFRKKSFISCFASKTIAGQGLDGYIQAIEFFLNKTTSNT